MIYGPLILEPDKTFLCRNLNKVNTKYQLYPKYKKSHHLNKMYAYDAILVINMCFMLS